MFHKFKRVIFIIFLLVFSVNLTAQISKIQRLDSLKNELNKASIDTTKVNLLLNISKYFERTCSDSAIYYANTALNLSEKIKWKEGEASSKRYLGFNYTIQSNYPKGLKYLTESLQDFKVLNEDKNIANAHSNLAYFYAERINEKEALKHFTKANAIYTKLNDTKGLSTNYINMGVLYSYLKNYDKSFLYYNKALKIEEENDDIFGKFSISFNLAEDFNEQNKLCEALKYGLKAKYEADLLNTPYDKGFGHYLLGGIYLNAHKDTLNTFKKCKYFYATTSNIALAEFNLKKALSYFKEVNDLLSISNTYKLLSEVYENLDNSKLALTNYKMFTKLKDSVFSKENRVKIANIEKQYEINLRAKQLKEHEFLVHRKQDQLYFLLGFLFLGALLVSFFIYFQHKKQKVEHILNEQLASKNLELQRANSTKDKFFSIISHDLRSPFNSLIGLSELLITNFDAYEKEKIKKFVKAIHNTSVETHKLLENLLEWSRLQRNAIDPVFETVNLYEITNNIFLMLNNMADEKNILFQNNIGIKINAFCDKEMTKTILRNLISNAIKFTSKGAIIIDTKVKDAFIEIQVKDTGVGIASNVLMKLFNIDENYTTLGTENEKGTGLGLPICKELVEKQGGKIWVESEQGKGSVFIFTLPINLLKEN